MKKLLTMKDIARLSGVSIATVSRVISNPEKVKEKTREKVKRVIQETGFVPNAIASELSSQKKRAIIGVVVEELANPFFMELIAGMEGIVQEQGYSLTFFSTNWNIEKEIISIKTLINWRVEGVLLATPSASSESIYLLNTNNIPYMLINSQSSEDDISIVADNYGGGTLVADLFFKKPREQNIVVTGIEDFILEARTQGFFDKADELGIQYVVEKNISTHMQGYDMAGTLIAKYSLNKIKTNMWVTNDNVAIAIMLALRELRIEIPTQVAIIGFDNIQASKCCYPALTTIEQLSGEMGKLSIQLLLKKITQENIEHKRYVFPTKLIERESF